MSNPRRKKDLSLHVLSPLGFHFSDVNQYALASQLIESCTSRCDADKGTDRLCLCAGKLSCLEKLLEGVLEGAKERMVVACGSVQVVFTQLSILMSNKPAPSRNTPKNVACKLHQLRLRYCVSYAGALQCLLAWCINL